MGDDPTRLYRLDGVAHIAGVINDEVVSGGGLSGSNNAVHVMCSPSDASGACGGSKACDSMTDTAFVERWRPETHTFHMPFGECTITLQDVTYQLGLPVDGRYVSGCLSEFHIYIQGGRLAWVWFQELLGVVPPPSQVQKYAVNCSWFQETFGECPEGADDETMRRYARAYIMMLLGTQLFADKSGNRIHIRWLPYVARLDEMGTYSWGSAALAWLYRCMCRVANRHVVKLAGPLQLLQSWIFWRFPRFRPEGYETFSWPLASRWSGYNSSGSDKGPRVQMWRLRIDRLQDREFIWMPYTTPDVLQVVHPEALEPRHMALWRSVASLIYFAVIEWYQIDRLQKWHLYWDSHADTVLRFDVVADPGPSQQFLDWWRQHGKKFLSPEMQLMDPRAVPILVEASQRGVGRVPDMDRPEDVPDRRQVERRARVGTRRSQHKWRWLDAAIDDHDDDGPTRGGRRGQGGRRRGRGAGDHRPRDPDDDGDDQHGPVGGDGAGAVAVHGVSTHDGRQGGEWYGSGMGDVADPGHAGLGSGPLGDYFVGVPAHDQPQQEGTPWFLDDITAIMQEDVPARRRGQTSVTQAPLDVDLNDPPTASVGDHFGLRGTPPSAYATASESVAGPSAAPAHFTPPAQPGPDEDADEIEDEEPFIRRGQQARYPVVAVRDRICLDESCIMYFVP
ncbi:uncharacterized protein DS421_6g191940 [Arachis hypogaea]|nr:uncharacterized protein DS421_6g191940 [Arachis hypogaea]